MSKKDKKEKLINKLNENIKYDIYNKYDDNITFYYHFIYLFYNESKYNFNDLVSICIHHGFRVWCICETIIKYHEDIGFRKYTNHEKEIIKIAALFHDIGKTFKKTDHAKWGSIIMEYLFELEYSRNNKYSLSTSTMSEIINIIKFHGSKEKYRDRISDLTKVVRDADRLDEMCGESLLDLALSYVKNNKEIKYNKLEKANLNYLDYKLSDMIMAQRNSEETKAMIKRELNFDVDYDLYLQLLHYANEAYDRRTQYHRFRDKLRVHIF